MRQLISPNIIIDKNNKSPFKSERRLSRFHDQDNPYNTIQNGKAIARAWAKTLCEKDHSSFAQTFVFKIIEFYWRKAHAEINSIRPLPTLFEKFDEKELDQSVLELAETIGLAASKLNVIEASYFIGTTYTAVLPGITRSSNGVFYTPPALTKRLINIAEDAGVNWSQAKVIDPACGGGAFLAPVCLKIVEALSHKEPEEIINHIQANLTGLEIDPFGGWLSQVFVEVALKDLIKASGISIRSLVSIENSLDIENIGEHNRYDLVIGNPPYGKVKLTDTVRNKFKASLFGHANYYGLFTHLALDLVKEGGVIGFLTPTSFLSGEYFKNLRSLIRSQASPLEIDFVSFRKGVFEDVLQETMLTVYKKAKCAEEGVRVNQITTVADQGLNIYNTGVFQLPQCLHLPWILPKTQPQARAVLSMARMNFRLKDWGYKVSTGPLVWNRHKGQLTNNAAEDTYPIVWAEAITQDGRFILRAEKRNHSAYFKFQPGDDWLITERACILLQRTTSKEQDKRLIATALPEKILAQNKGVVVENHLNMIIPIVEGPAVSPMVLAAFLNSRAVNEAFRTISGSVAVSAYELESLPLPSPDSLRTLIDAVAGQKQEVIEAQCQKFYKHI